MGGGGGGAGMPTVDITHPSRHVQFPSHGLFAGENVGLI